MMEVRGRRPSRGGIVTDDVLNPISLERHPVSPAVLRNSLHVRKYCQFLVPSISPVVVFVQREARSSQVDTQHVQL